VREGEAGIHCKGDEGEGGGGGYLLREGSNGILPRNGTPILEAMPSAPPLFAKNTSVSTITACNRHTTRLKSLDMNSSQTGPYAYTKQHFYKVSYMNVITKAPPNIASVLS
jgi:hypothetical protein